MWLPLESNPEIFSNYQKALGFPIDHYKWREVHSLDPEKWSASFTSQPVLAAIFCFEVKKKYADMI